MSSGHLHPRSKEVGAIMNSKHNIRNMSVIGHTGHGKSTLTNSLLKAAGIIAKEDTCQTLKSTVFSLVYGMTDSALEGLKEKHNKNQYVFNIVDSPGVVDFSSEVSAALRITDGAIVVVDCLEGVRIQTENVIHQALRENIRPVLVINKIDCCFTHFDLDGETFYSTLKEVVNKANKTIALYKDSPFGDPKLYPETGTVAFICALQGWGFTLQPFAKKFADKFGVDYSKTLKRLWGDNFFDYKTKKWTVKNTGSKTCKRGFIQFVYEPIKQIISTCMERGLDKLLIMVKKIGVTLDEKEKELMGEGLMTCIMQKWLPAHDALAEMAVNHLPSPLAAQVYRVANLYTGELSDKYAKAIRSCDSEGPLMVYVSKVFPVSDSKGKFAALGRVFSGRISRGMKVRIMSSNHVCGDKKNNEYAGQVQRTAIRTGGNQEVTFKHVSSGNIVLLYGLDENIKNFATLTNENEDGACPITDMRFTMAPVVHQSVTCTDTSKLAEGIKLLAKWDPLVAYTSDIPGEFVMAGASKGHLEICVEYLEKNFIGGDDKITVSDPFVRFHETVTEISPQTVTKLLGNGGLIEIKATELDVRVTDAIDYGRIRPHDGLNACKKLLFDNFEWGETVGELWCFGPDKHGPNMLVAARNAIGCTEKFKNLVIEGFQLASMKGSIAGEKMRGICIEICDLAEGEADGIQDLPNIIREVIHKAQEKAEPRLVEPFYWFEIQVSHDMCDGIKEMVEERRGKVDRRERRLGPGTETYNIKGLLPVAASFEFNEDVRIKSKAVAYFMFDHWGKVYSDSDAAEMVSQIKKRKNAQGEGVGGTED